MAKAKIAGWVVERHKENVYRASRPNRTVYFMLVKDTIKQCDKNGFVSPTFILAFTDELRKKISMAAKSLP